MGERLGGLHSARCLLASVDFADVERLQVEGRWDEAGQLLAEAAKGLEAAGADRLLLCTNTMHKVADQVQAAVSIPLLHLADATARAGTRSGLSKVGLLGTAFTMEQDFYRDRLAAGGLTVLIPPPDDRADVHRIIYDELCVGVQQVAGLPHRDVIGRPQCIHAPLDMTRCGAATLDRMDRRVHRPAALVAHDQDQRRLEVVRRELDAAQHHAFVEHLAPVRMTARSPIPRSNTGGTRESMHEKIVANGCCSCRRAARRLTD